MPAAALDGLLRLLEEAHDLGHTSQRVHSSLAEWHGRTVDALATANDMTQAAAARQATFLRTAVTQLRAGLPAHPLQSLAAEAANVLDLGGLDIILLAGVSEEPTTYLLPIDDGLVVLIFDGLDYTMKDGRQGLLLHEVAHAREEIRKLADSSRDTFLKRAELLADLLALCVGGTGFAGALRELFTVSGFTPEQELPRHPSFALRHDFLLARAGAWWPAPYHDEVSALLGPMQGHVGDGELGRKAGVDAGHLQAAIANGKIPHESVYRCRAKKGPCTPRVQLSADVQGQP